MLGLLKDFLLFGVIEVFILMMFYKYIGEVKEVKLWHGIPLCIIIFILSFISIPFCRQIFGIIIYLLYINLISKRNMIDSLKISIGGMLYILVVETIYVILIQIIMNFNIMEIGSSVKFYKFIPMRIIEFLLIVIYRQRRKIWDFFGGAMLKS